MLFRSELEMDGPEDYEPLIREWVESVNDEIIDRAEIQLQDRESGDWWRD